MLVKCEKLLLGQIFNESNLPSARAVESILATVHFNLLTPNDDHSGRNAPLTSKRCILYIYSTNTGTEYFKHGIYSPFFSSSKCSLFHKSNLFGSCIFHILYTGCAKIKKIIPGPKGYVHCFLAWFNSY